MFPDNAIDYIIDGYLIDSDRQLIRNMFALRHASEAEHKAQFDYCRQVIGHAIERIRNGR